MRVEACCQALLAHLLPDLDPNREGFCFDVGVGTFAFYCEQFAQLGFTTVAVEPLPTEPLRALCQRQGITLIEQCLSDRVGTQTLHLGQFAKVANANFSSLSADWFGASENTRPVATLDLAALLDQVAATHITAFKLDIEGWEPVVLRQFQTLPEAQLPRLVMFEYGGGSSRCQGERGWSAQFLEGSLSGLRSLQQRGYGYSIMVDYAPGTRPKIFDLQTLDLEQDSLFYPNGIYGNIITLHQHRYPEAQIQAWCQPYQGGLINWVVSQLVAYTSTRSPSPRE